jgi:hypothetical protein
LNIVKKRLFRRIAAYMEYLVVQSSEFQYFGITYEVIYQCTNYDTYPIEFQRAWERYQALYELSFEHQHPKLYTLPEPLIVNLQGKDCLAHVKLDKSMWLAGECIGIPRVQVRVGIYNEQMFLIDAEFPEPPYKLEYTLHELFKILGYWDPNDAVKEFFNICVENDLRPSEYIELYDDIMYRGYKLNDPRPTLTCRIDPAIEEAMKLEQYRRRTTYQNAALVIELLSVLEGAEFAGEPTLWLDFFLNKLSRVVSGNMSYWQSNGPLSMYDVCAYLSDMPQYQKIRKVTPNYASAACKIAMLLRPYKLTRRYASRVILECLIHLVAKAAVCNHITFEEVVLDYMSEDGMFYIHKSDRYNRTWTVEELNRLFQRKKVNSSLVEKPQKNPKQKKEDSTKAFTCTSESNSAASDVKQQESNKGRIRVKKHHFKTGITLSQFLPNLDYLVN